MRWLMVTSLGLTAVLTAIALDGRDTRREAVERLPGRVGEAPRRDGGPRNGAQPVAAPVAVKAAPRRAAAPDGRWRVRFVGGDERPIGGLMVTVLHARPKLKIQAHTDSSGDVYLSPVAGARVKVDEKEWPVRQPQTTIKIADAIPLVVRVVDAYTGLPVEAKVNAAGPRAVITHVRPHVRVGPTVNIEPVTGYARRYVHVAGGVSRLAAAACLVVPVYPEADVRVTVQDADGSLAPAKLWRAYLGGDDAVFQAPGAEPPDCGAWMGSWAQARLEPLGGSGVYAVRGVPRLLGERLHLILEQDERHAHVSLGLDGAPANGVVTLPRERNDVAPGNVGISGGSMWRRGCGRRVVRGHDTLRVRLCRRDGTPARRVEVSLRAPAWQKGRTDARGEVVFENLARRRTRLEIVEPGFVFTTRDVDIRPGTNSVDVVEAAGLHATVVVRDARYRRLAGARVYLTPDNSVPHVEWIGATQRLAYWTNGRGELDLRSLPDVDVEIRAMYGTRSVQGTLQRGESMLWLAMPDAG